MGVNLTPGAISKIVTGKEYVAIADEILISNKLQKGSIVQLTNFQLTKIIKSNSMGEIISKSGIRVCDLNLRHTTCDIIGDPKLYPPNETPLVEKTTPTIPHEDHANSHHVEEPPTSIQNPTTSTQKCSSSSPTQNKKRKLQSSDDIISGFEKDISKLVSMTVEKTIEDGLGACYKKLGTLEEGVSKMTKLMMEKSKEVDAGFKKLETLEDDVCKLTKLMMEKNKDVVGFKKVETLEEDVSKMAKMMMEKNKDVVGFKKLETLEEDVSKMAKMMTDKNKEDDMGACIEKLDKMGWGAEEPIYDAALLLFLKGADYRKLWLHLKPERCGKWVKIAGSIFGLLD